MDYYLIDADGQAVSSTSLSKWTGFASENENCKNLDGTPLFTSPTPDEDVAEILSGKECHANTYGFAWNVPSGLEGKSEYLNTIFFIPKAATLMLSKSCSATLLPSEFILLGSDGSSTFIKKSKDSPIGLGDSPFKIGQFLDVFAKVRNKGICISLSSINSTSDKMDFFWNGNAVSSALLDRIETNVRCG